MSFRSLHGRGRVLPGRGPGRRPAAALVLLLLVTGATACGGGDTTDTAKDLGRVPIPSAPAAPVVPTASAGHAQIVAMGDAVHLDLGTGQAQVTATGPDLEVTGPSAGGAPPEQSKGTVTVVLRVPDGSRQLDAGTVSAADELGHPLQLTPDAPTVTAVPGHDAVLHLAGTFAAGHATLTLNDAGKPLATWDFEIELD
ncbi:hypothetical protein [Kitasatospora aureofaciens]|uniref:hypothetical protein n=1 Tax=Kitasatospora aureofaciens TaxID=1894 RepID=UPI001C4868CB|nr:hypothetical protein [Kitasatospora aureofaciens]MBV6702236.1 hypothetical protein [Kitasatospora aureofaciens]